MLAWCAILFVLGVLAFVDAVFNMGEIFRQVNSILFLLLSLALLIRTTTKAKSKKREQYEMKIIDMENEIQKLRNEQDKLNSYY